MAMLHRIEQCARCRTKTSYGSTPSCARYLEYAPRCVDQSFSRTLLCPSKIFAPEHCLPGTGAAMLASSFHGSPICSDCAEMRSADAREIGERTYRSSAAVC